MNIIPRVEFGIIDKSLDELGYNKRKIDIKNILDNISPSVWKKMRWYINFYDFNIKPPLINRAFYKFWEMLVKFSLFEDYDYANDLIFHCAEAPGGFIQCSNMIIKETQTPSVEKSDFTKVVSRKKITRDNIKIYTMSLKNINGNLPEYNKNIINKNVKIFYGEDNTGDITNYNNILCLKKKAGKNFYLITADGGFDEEGDFEHKEQIHYKLVFNEILSAISLIKKDGHFVIKMFDIFTKSSLDMLYLLYNLFDEFYIYKPKTSRPTNSEKYIVCKYFKFEEEQKKEVVDKLSSISSILKQNESKFIKINLYDTKDISQEFIQKIKKINTEYSDKQYSFLLETIKLCDKKRQIAAEEKEDNKSIREKIFKDWCEEYNLRL